MKSAIRVSSFGLLLGALFFGYCSFAQTTPKKSLAAECAPDLDTAKERVFSNRDGNMWKEYASSKQVPRSVGSGPSMISVKTSSSGKHFVRTIEYGEQSARYSASCYDAAGHLRQFHYEMRTGSGWGYEDARSFDAAGKQIKHSTRYLDTKTNQTTQKPADAASAGEFTKPTIYNTFDSLPIAGALKQNAKAQ